MLVLVWASHWKKHGVATRCIQLGNLYIYAGSTIQRSAHHILGRAVVCVKSLFLMDFWQIQRIYAIVMMSETVGIDIHEIEWQPGVTRIRITHSIWNATYKVMTYATVLQLSCKSLCNVQYCSSAHASFPVLDSTACSFYEMLRQM